MQTLKIVNTMTGALAAKSAKNGQNIASKKHIGQSAA